MFGNTAWSYENLKSGIPVINIRHWNDFIKCCKVIVTFNTKSKNRFWKTLLKNWKFRKFGNPVFRCHHLSIIGGIFRFVFFLWKCNELLKTNPSITIISTKKMCWCLCNTHDQYGKEHKFSLHDSIIFSLNISQEKKLFHPQMVFFYFIPAPFILANFLMNNSFSTAQRQEYPPGTARNKQNIAPRSTSSKSYCWTHCLPNGLACPVQGHAIWFRGIPSSS